MIEEEKKASFGFKQVPQGQKQGMVNDVFNQVANKYDLMNNLMSFGLHHLWKKMLVNKITNLSSNLLDLAAGTGDIGINFYKKAVSKKHNPYVALSDINDNMLQIARDKAVDNGIITNFDFVLADAERLPFGDNSFDYCTIAFGIRNTTNVSKVLQEAYRVLKPTGNFLCLEFAKIDNKVVRQLYNAFAFSVIPRLGGLIAGNKDAYSYLVESIETFFCQEELTMLMKHAEFKKVTFQNLSFGIAAIYSGYKI